MFMTDKKPSNPYCIFLINLSHHHWESNIINWGQILDTANIYILLSKMKFYKQRIMLNYQNIPGSYNDTKCIAKDPYSPLYAKRFVNEFKAIDVINYTDKIKQWTFNTWWISICICPIFTNGLHGVSIIFPNHLKWHACAMCKITEEEWQFWLRQKCCQKMQMKLRREIFFLFFFWYSNNQSKKIFSLRKSTAYSAL